MLSRDDQANAATFRLTAQDEQSDAARPRQGRGTCQGRLVCTWVRARYNERRYADLRCFPSRHSRSNLATLVRPMP